MLKFKNVCFVIILFFIVGSACSQGFEKIAEDKVDQEQIMLES